MKKTKTANIKILSRHIDKGDDYPKDISSLLFRAEEKHFWFWGRNKIIESVVRKVFGKKKNITILEIGCGTGFVLSYLERLGYSVTGLDISLASLKLAQRRVKKSDLICADATSVKLGKKFDAVCLFDVVEHISHDADFIKKCARHLKPDGVIFITVPADNNLWSAVDEVSCHKRRYSKKELIKRLDRKMFSVEFVSYFNFFLYFPLLIHRRLKHRELTSGRDTRLILKKAFKIPKLLNRLFKFIFALEAVLLKFMIFPTGTSLILAARKRHGDLLT